MHTWVKCIASATKCKLDQTIQNVDAQLYEKIIATMSTCAKLIAFNNLQLKI